MRPRCPDSSPSPCLTAMKKNLLGCVMTACLGFALTGLARENGARPGATDNAAGHAQDDGARCQPADESPSPWQPLEPGLDLGVFSAPEPSGSSDSKIRVLRIDSLRFDLRLMMASAANDGDPMTARQWCLENGLVAAINASMYQEDHRTSVALMRTRAHTNNNHLTKDKAVLAFDGLDEKVPGVQIIDRTCQDFDALANRYGSLVQSIRMVSCQGKNVWSPQPMKWSAAAIGIDFQGRILFIFSRSPYTMHDLIDMLLELPIGLKNAQYAEGGPEAQLYVRSGDTELEFCGSYEANFIEDESSKCTAPVPNVVGIARR